MNYDDRGQLTSESTTYGDQTYAVSYSYDIRGRRNEITYPSGRKAQYSHTDRGLLDTIKWDGSEIEDRDYNAIAQLTNIDRPAIDESRTYTNNGQVETIANGAVGTATYAYDANGNKLSESWSGAMASWNFTTQAGGSDGYDAEDRFMNFNQSGQSKTLAMTRSNIGNITNVSLNGTGAARGYSNAHELTSVGSNSQSFDTDGNLTLSTVGNTYAWDEAGMMEQATVAGGPTIDYGYAADGKRIWKKVGTTETVYVHSGPNCIAEYVKGAAPASSGNEYVYAAGIDSLVMLSRSAGSEKLAVTRNQQWSISALINAAGTVVERYTYAEFGKRTILAANGSTVRTSSSYNMPYGYTSRRHEDETGLMYFRARYYDTKMGEFISRDPLGYRFGPSLYRWQDDDLLDLPLFPEIPWPKTPLPRPVPPPPVPPIDLPPVDEPDPDLLEPIVWTCEQVLANLKNMTHPAIKRALKCNANIFCGDCGGKFGGIAYYPIEGGHAHVCINAKKMENVPKIVLEALIIHELVHVGQYLDSGECGCKDTPYQGPRPPFPPKIGGTDCEACEAAERPAYQAQAEHLYPSGSPGAAEFHEAFVRWGLYLSCGKACSYKGPRPPYPAVPVW